MYKKRGFKTQTRREWPEEKKFVKWSIINQVRHITDKDVLNHGLSCKIMKTVENRIFCHNLDIVGTFRHFVPTKEQV